MATSANNLSAIIEINKRYGIVGASILSCSVNNSGGLFKADVTVRFRDGTQLSDMGEGDPLSAVSNAYERIILKSATEREAPATSFVDDPALRESVKERVDLRNKLGME